MIEQKQAQKKEMEAGIAQTRNSQNARRERIEALKAQKEKKKAEIAIIKQKTQTIRAQVKNQDMSRVEA